MNQRVLITGAATGIGLETARAFSAIGATVFITDVSDDALAAATKQLPGLRTARCDNARRADIEVVIPAAIDALGGLDVLVNNVGVAGPTSPTEHYDPGEWDRVIAVNLTGTFDVTRLAIPHLRRSPRGVIINMSSAAGRFGYANRSAYSASKWGIVGFTKTLAIELGGDGIRANAILPGPVAGPRIESVFAGRAEVTGKSVNDVRAAAMAGQSIQQLVDPRDIAALIVFLASDSAKSISGQILPIDNDMQMAG